MEKPKKDKKTIIYILIFLLGVSIMLYPWASNKWNEYRSSKLIETYESESDSGKYDNELELKKAVKYNEKLSPRVVPDAFSDKEGERDKEYESILAFDKGIMGFIEIPAIDIELPIYHYTNEESLKKGVGHLPGSSLPVGGKGTHAVLSAHRGLPSAKLFTDLNLLEKGDAFYVNILDKRLKYEVDQIETVKPDQTDSLGMVKGKDYVTLVTCTPYGVNTHRLLVRGIRVPLDEEADDSGGRFDMLKIVRLLLCIIDGIILCYIAVWISDRIRKRKQGESK